MNRKRGLTLLTVAVALAALLALLLARNDEAGAPGGVDHDVPQRAPMTAESISSPRGVAAAAVPVEERPGTGGSPEAPSGVDSGALSAFPAPDAGQSSGESSESTIPARLAEHGARAKKEVERFCEANAKLKKTPRFEERPRTRDAAVFMASRVDWEGTPPRYGSLNLSEPLKLKLRGQEQWLSIITTADLAGLDFGWMKQLLAFDVWTFNGDGAGERGDTYAMALDIPNFVSLQHWVRLRFARALLDGDWADAVIEVRHLAYLTHTMGLVISEMIAGTFLHIETRARAQAAALGVDLSGLPPPTPFESFDTLRHAVFPSARFTMPGVPPEVRRRALECAAEKCVTAAEALSMQASLRAWASPGELEAVIEETRRLGCDERLFASIVKTRPATPKEALELLGWLEGDPFTLSADAGR